MLELGLSIVESVYNPPVEYQPPRLVRRIASANIEAWNRFVRHDFDQTVVSQDSLFRYLRYQFDRLRGDRALPPEISVVVPVHNEEKYLLSLLMSLSIQETDKRIEIVPVDNNSTRVGDRQPDGSVADRDDLTLFYCELLGLNAISYREEGNSIGLARQKGIEHAQAPIICMTDGDTIVSRRWLDATSAPFFSDQLKDIYVSVVAGDVHYYDQVSILEPIVSAFEPTRANAVIAQMRRIHLAQRPVPSAWAYGPNLAFRKADALQVGGFPFNSAGEDTEFVNRLGSIGEVRSIEGDKGSVWVSSRRLSRRTLVPIVLSALTGRDLIHEDPKDGSPIVVR